MRRPSLSAALAALTLAGSAPAASLTPPNLSTATTLSNPDLLLVWPNASSGPLEAMQWSTFKAQMALGLGASFLQPANNLSDLASPTTARTNLGLGTAATANVVSSGNGLGLLNAGNSWSATQTFQGGAGTAPINLAPGSPPASPNNGDLWTTSAGVYARVNGSTQQLGGAVSGSLTPTLAYQTPGTSSFSYVVQQGSFVCIAGVVSGWARVEFTPTNGTASGNLFWTNPPYQSATNGADTSAGIGPPVAFRGSGWTGVSGVYTLGAIWSTNQYPFVNNQGTTWNYITTSNLTSGSQVEMVWQFNYLTSTGGC